MSAHAVTSPSARLALRGVCKRFGSFEALRNVSLDVEPGEFVCLLGPSGSGKTTLLRVIAGFERQDAGAILANGKDIAHAPPAERDFGIVFQSYALFPNLSVADNVGFGLVNQRWRRADIRDRVTELLLLVGLSRHRDKFPSQISGGEQQRVALARALAHAPSLLLLDEPLSALDARVRLQLREELKALQQRLGVTTVMVTHDQNEALSLADRLVVLDGGEIQQVGTPAEVYARPGSVFVADFVGAMNLLPAVVQPGGLAAVGGLRLAVAEPTSHLIGRHVVLGVRPEAIRLAASPNDANAFSARIHSLGFHGSFQRAVLRPGAAPGVSLTVDWSTGQDPIGPAARHGDVTATIPPERLMVFPA